MSLDSLCVDLYHNICIYLDMRTIAAARCLNRYLSAVLGDIFETTIVAAEMQTEDITVNIVRDIFKYGFMNGKSYLDIDIKIVCELMPINIINITQVLGFYVINCYISSDTYCIYVRCSDLCARYLIQYSEIYHPDWIDSYLYVKTAGFCVGDSTHYPIWIAKSYEYLDISRFMNVYKIWFMDSSSFDDSGSSDHTLMDYYFDMDGILDIISEMPHKCLAEVLVTSDLVKYIPLY